jgi:hypothetical protein
MSESELQAELERLRAENANIGSIRSSESYCLSGSEVRSQLVVVVVAAAHAANLPSGVRRH